LQAITNLQQAWLILELFIEDAFNEHNSIRHAPNNVSYCFRDDGMMQSTSF
jgi:hypothetical protein